MTQFVPALLAKLTLIFASGLVVAAVLRGLSPSLRHLMLFATIVSGLALLFAMFVPPQWSVPLLPASLSSVPSSAADKAAGSSANDRKSNSFATPGKKKKNE